MNEALSQQARETKSDLQLILSETAWELRLILSVLTDRCRHKPTLSPGISKEGGSFTTRGNSSIINNNGDSYMYIYVYIWNRIAIHGMMAERADPEKKDQIQNHFRPFLTDQIPSEV